MPAEAVYGEQTMFEPGGEPRKPHVTVAEVRWGRDMGYVQVVTKCQDAEGGRYMGEEYAEESHVTDGFYVDLNRQAINRLIRNLRRARDQAFGRDE